jgi:hypothetical protein
VQPRQVSRSPPFPSPPPSQSKATALHVASRSGRLAVVRLLLSYHASASVVDDFGWTPLHDAAAAARVARSSRGGGRGVGPDDFPAIVRALCGAHPTALEAVTTKNMRTPLHIAVEHDDPSMTLALLRAGADPMALDEVRYEDRGGEGRRGPPHLSAPP